MMNNWFKDMEKVTICIGFAIVYLGINNAIDNPISPALVTGISLSGLCLTLADFLNKQFKDCKSKLGLNILYFFDFLLYGLATLWIIGYPNSTFVKSLDKEKLDWLSTSASVIALGVVFIAIGTSNRKAVLEEEKKRFEEIQGMFNETSKIAEQFRELAENRNEVIEKKVKQIKELEEKVNELEGKKTTASA
ncbi:hypothetical protein ACTFO3_25845 [Bacillus cereus group sp. MYBK69-2]|uniref:hypothetical protein n=1 Tax=unclassified Bacillus cereus group TaxID=2750818 RepID=UPI003F7AC994